MLPVSKTGSSSDPDYVVGNSLSEATVKAIVAAKFNIPFREVDSLTMNELHGMVRANTLMTKEIAAGKEHVRKMVETPEFRAVQARHAAETQRHVDRLTATSREFFTTYKPLVDSELKAVGFDLNCNDNGERFLILCDLVEVDPNTVKLGELHRKVRAWIQRKKIEATIGQAANREETDTIPAEYQTEPMSMAEAARKLKYATNRSDTDAGRKRVKREIESGILRAGKVSAKKYRFDSRQVR